MIRAAACAALLAAPVAAAGTETPLPVPSGQEVTFLDVVTTASGPAGLTYRFRFVAPWIAGAADFASVEGDMAYLCETYALPRVSNIGPKPRQIIVSFMEQPVGFGQTAPDVVQFFEAYAPEDNICVWELF